jgi:glycosyltransferase involved in cell wall biosynthesis
LSEVRSRPAIVVFSSLFPSPAQPNAGVFVRERMFRVGAHVPLCVVAPTPWFPFQSLIRRWRPHFRPTPPGFVEQQGISVWYPRFLSFPGVLKSLDGFFMALGALPRMRRLRQEGRLDLIDAHFAYPDGYAATLIGRWLKVPVTITMRGTEVRHAVTPGLRERLTTALASAQQVFSVSDALRQLALGLGISGSKVVVVGNGVDAQRFQPMDRSACRQALDLQPAAPVLVSVGGLVERKGFHRVIEVLPDLVAALPDLVFLIVGGPSAEGDNRAELQAQVERLGLQRHVRFLGTRKPEDLSEVLSAADVFVLATRNEGWANVFLEAMACGLPVVTTDVGGNREVVCRQELGTVVPFGDAVALRAALDAALQHPWNRGAIRSYAEQNAWDGRVQILVSTFSRLTQG